MNSKQPLSRLNMAAAGAWPPAGFLLGWARVRQDWLEMGGGGAAGRGGSASVGGSGSGATPLALRLQLLSLHSSVHEEHSSRACRRASCTQLALFSPLRRFNLQMQQAGLRDSCEDYRSIKHAEQDSSHFRLKVSVVLPSCQHSPPLSEVITRSMNTKGFVQGAPAAR